MEPPSRFWVFYFIWGCPTQIFLLSTSQIASSFGKRLAARTRNIGSVGLSRTPRTLRYFLGTPTPSLLPQAVSSGSRPNKKYCSRWSHPYYPSAIKFFVISKEIEISTSATFDLQVGAVPPLRMSRFLPLVERKKKEIPVRDRGIVEAPVSKSKKAA